MRLVVDANILFSFFRDNPVRSIILFSENLGLELFAPAHVIDELRKNIPDLIKYTKLSSNEISEIMEELKEYVYVYKSSVYEDFKEKGQELSPHDSDKDTPYFSLALKLECGIWSNEPGFKKQSKVRIFNTRDLRELLDKDF